MRLLEPDQRAVDLLLDHGQSSSVQDGGPGYAASSIHFSVRVRCVKRLLNLLETVSPEEPPKDLVGRTLAHIVSHNGRGAASMTQVSSSRRLVDTRHPAV